MTTAAINHIDLNAYDEASHPPEGLFVHVPLRIADAKRSVRNIRQWNAYLPTDCVRKMVSMGWDYTT